MSREKNFVKNTLILALGKLATQFTSFLLIPLFTNKLEASDYGTADLIQTYIGLLVPILILRFDSSIFRFLIDERNNDKSENAKKIISSSFLSVFLMAILFGIACLIISFFINFDYLWYTYANIVAIMFSNTILQIARGLGKNKLYSIASIITGVTILSTNCFLILGLNFDASSILISSTIGNIACSLFLFFTLKLYRNLSIKAFSRTETKDMLKYSLPMIPNSLSWWIINTSDRSLISLAQGTAANGIYAISCKFPSLITGVSSIFSASWQENASIHIKDSDANKYFSTMIDKMMLFFSSITTLIIAILPLLFNIVIGEKYIEAYTYIPILMIGGIFNILTQLIGGIYVARKETAKIMRATIFSAIVNLAIDLVFVWNFGIYAASFSTLIAYVATALFRYHDVKKRLGVRVKTKNIFSSFILLTIATVAYYLNNKILAILVTVLIVTITILTNKEFIKKILKTIKQKTIR